jgi:hypothetical protein
LAGVISNASATYQTGGRADFRRTDWSTVDAQAAAILSPAQLALFKQIEPLGGGPSRWMGNLQRLLDETRPRGGSGTALAKPPGN